MAFEEGLYSYLSTYPGLVPLIGTRIYPLLLPQDPVLPAVTYQRISTPRMHAFERSFLPHPRFQFDCWATTFPAARAVAEQVKLALDVYMGAMGAETVQASILDGDRDIYEAEAKIFHSIVDAIIWHV